VKRTGPDSAAGRKRKATVRFAGTVVSGLGMSASFLAIPWVTDQLSKNLSFSPYCGTLNIRLHDTEAQKALKRGTGRRIIPAEHGFCEALLFEGTVAGRYPCAAILPLVANYPEDVLEIIAPVHLKQTLGIGDGDGIEVELKVS
jgi:riboflavin kinase